MDRVTAIAQLPEAYASALRLREANLDDATLAEQLGVEVEALSPLLRLAEAKLAHIMHVAHGGQQQEGGKKL